MKKKREEETTRDKDYGTTEESEEAARPHQTRINTRPYPRFSILDSRFSIESRVSICNFLESENFNSHEGVRPCIVVAMDDDSWEGSSDDEQGEILAIEPSETQTSPIPEPAQEGSHTPKFTAFMLLKYVCQRIIPYVNSHISCL